MDNIKMDLRARGCEVGGTDSGSCSVMLNLWVLLPEN